MQTNLAYLSEYKNGKVGGPNSRQSTLLVRPAHDAEKIVRWAADPDNRNAVLDNSWEGLYGEQEYKVARSGWIYIVHPDDRLGVIQRSLLGRVAGGPYRNHFRALVHGIYRPMSAVVFPVKDEAGRIVRWEGYNELLQDDKAANF